jgi:sporulation protein YlmC with PRC-barrel domain
MRITELKGQRVVDKATALTLGVIIDVFVDATAARIVALEVAAHAGGRGIRIPAEWITRVGSCAVMVGRRSAADPGVAGPATEHCLTYDSLAGLEVWDESGDRVGYLQDAAIDAQRLVISRFELVPAGWRCWLHLRREIRPDEVGSWSRELMLVRGRRAGSDHHRAA